MKKYFLLPIFILVYLFIMSSGCSDDEPTTPEPDEKSDAYPPGYVWQAGDYPSLTAPVQITDNVIIGEPVRAFTVLNKGKFKPKLNAVNSNSWVVRIYREESALCELWYQWSFYTNYWSHSIPVKRYEFDWPSFPYDCWWHSDSFVDKGGQDFWPTTQTRSFLLMENGSWYTTTFEFWLNNQSWKGDSYDVWVRFNQPSHPDLYVSMVRTWVVGQKADDDVVRTEGHAEVTVHKLRGVDISNTNEFTETWGLSAGIDVKGISAGLNATFSSSSSHTVNLSEIEETTEIRDYNVPANEQWRYITIYGVERYLFTDANGYAWSSEYLDCNYLGVVDNNVRTFLMIVKYNSGTDRPYSKELIEIVNEE